MDSISIMEMIDGLYEGEEYSLNMEEVVNDVCDFMNRYKFDGVEKNLFDVRFRKLTQHKDVLSLELKLVVLGEEDKKYLDFYVERKLVVVK